MNTSTMKNFLHQNNWNQGAVQVQVDPPPMLLIRSKNNEKSDKDCVKIKLHWYPMSKTFYLYEFKCTCLTTDIRMSSWFSSVVFKWLSRRQEPLLLERRSSIFVCWYVMKHYLRLTCCLLIWEVLPQNIKKTLFGV